MILKENQYKLNGKYFVNQENLFIMTLELMLTVVIVFCHVFYPICCAVKPY